MKIINKFLPLNLEIILLSCKNRMDEKHQNHSERYTLTKGKQLCSSLGRVPQWKSLKDFYPSALQRQKKQLNGL